MRQLIWLVALIAAGTAFAQETKAPAAPAPVVKAAPVKTHDVEAEIVAIDETAKTLTIKGSPDNKTVPVEGKALATLKTHKAGDKVTLVCRDNEKGEHQAVMAIKPAKPVAPATN
jgi:hypothetical protein